MRFALLRRRGLVAVLASGVLHAVLLGGLAVTTRRKPPAKTEDLVTIAIVSPPPIATAACGGPARSRGREMPTEPRRGRPGKPAMRSSRSAALPTAPRPSSEPSQTVPTMIASQPGGAGPTVAALVDASAVSQPVLVSAVEPGHGRMGAPKAATASTAQNAADQKLYFGRVLARIEAAKRYPGDAREVGASGAAIVRFALGPDGGLTSVTLVRSSGQASVDRGALEAVIGVAPFEAPPTDIAKPIWLEVRVRFDLQTIEERD